MQFNLRIPDSVTSIEDYAFSNCYSIMSVEISDSVTSIGEQTFSNCNSLTSAKIPKSVMNIGKQAFFYCISLTDVYYGGTEDEWNEISKDYDNDLLLKANIYFNSEGPGKFVDPVNGVKVQVSEAFAKTGAAFVVEDVDPASVGNIEINGLLYDIYFEKDGKQVQPGGEVTVSIPVPEGMDGDKCAVFYVYGSGNKTDMNAKHENGYLVFKTDHFSYYSVEEGGEAYIKGDINGDGQVNNKDITRLMRYVKYRDVEVAEAALDVNGDGQVNNKDITRLMRYVKYKDVQIN